MRRAEGIATGARAWVGGALAAALVGLLLATVGGVAAQEIPVRPPWQAQTADRQTAEITVGATPLLVELALTPAERSRGLGYRPGLLAGTGMLFLELEPQVQSFWMKGMRFCLDIVWIEGGQIVGAAEDACPSAPGTPDRALPRFVSPVPVSAVLEVPAGWLAANGYGVGTPVDFPFTVRAAD